jgi:hypothetical protein
MPDRVPISCSLSAAIPHPLDPQSCMDIVRALRGQLPPEAADVQLIFQQPYLDPTPSEWGKLVMMWVEDRPGSLAVDGLPTLSYEPPPGRSPFNA